MGIVLVLLFGLAMIFGPIAADISGHSLSTVNSSFLMIAGLVISLFAGILLVITKLYRKTQASEAFVRTGMGGFKIIKDGGAIVIPVIHKVVTITLRTMKFKLSRMGKQALLTKDKLRADIGAEFFVRVMPDDTSITNAARSFGEHMTSEEVANLVSEKAVSALRSVAATKTLEDLNSNRDDFMKEVTAIVAPDLAHNGLTLETATISDLDQTGTENYDPNNIFDAEGLATIAEHTEVKKTEANLSLRKGEQQRKEQDVVSRLKILEFDKNEKEAEATQAAEVAVIQAEQSREAEEKKIEAQREVDLAAVQREEAVQVATREQQKAVEVAERQKQQAVAVADQKKLEAETHARKDVEVADRAKQQAVADAEKLVATAETAQATAEAERETARQSVKTVAVVEEAERLKKQEVIQAEAEGDKNLVLEQRKADAGAYTVKKDAEARKEAADADAEAVRKKAEAEKERELFRAEGLRANQMVPVDVNEKQVQVDADRVKNVTIPELQAQNEYDLALKFDIQKVTIHAERDVRIEAAKATASVYARAEIKAYGTTEQLAQITAGMIKGQSLSELFNGFKDNLESDTVQAALKGVGKVVQTVGALARGSAPTDNNVATTPATDDAGGDTGADAG